MQIFCERKNIAIKYNLSEILLFLKTISIERELGVNLVINKNNTRTMILLREENASYFKISITLIYTHK